MSRGPSRKPTTVDGVAYDPMIRRVLSDDDIRYLEGLRHRIDMKFAEVDELSPDDITKFKEELEGNLDLHSVGNGFVSAVRAKTHGMSSQTFYTSFGNIMIAAGWDNVNSKSSFDVTITPTPRATFTKSGIRIPPTRVSENHQKRYDPEFMTQFIPKQHVDDVCIFVGDITRLDHGDFAILDPEKVLLRFVKLLDGYGVFRSILDSKYPNLDIEFGPFMVHYVKLGALFNAEFKSSNGDASMDVTTKLEAKYTAPPPDEPEVSNDLFSAVANFGLFDSTFFSFDKF